MRTRLPRLSGRVYPLGQTFLKLFANDFYRFSESCGDRNMRPAQRSTTTDGGPSASSERWCSSLVRRSQFRRRNDGNGRYDLRPLWPVVPPEFDLPADVDEYVRAAEQASADLFAGRARRLPQWEQDVFAMHQARGSAVRVRRADTNDGLATGAAFPTGTVRNVERAQRIEDVAPALAPTPPRPENRRAGAPDHGRRRSRSRLCRDRRHGVPTLSPGVAQYLPNVEVPIGSVDQGSADSFAGRARPAPRPRPRPRRQYGDRHPRDDTNGDRFTTATTVVAPTARTPSPPSEERVEHAGRVRRS